MKKILLSAILAVAGIGSAHAATDVNVVGSSWTFSGVQCTTGTAGQIDNYKDGAMYTVDSVRIGVLFQNQDSTYNVWLGYNPSVSTNTATAVGKLHLGQKVAPGDIVVKGALRNTKIYCLAADGAGANGVWLHTENVNKE